MLGWIQVLKRYRRHSFSILSSDSPSLWGEEVELWNLNTSIVEVQGLHQKQQEKNFPPVNC